MNGRLLVDEVVAFFETLDVANLEKIDRLYREDAFFKDPFNEVRGIAAIRRVFAHMFETVVEPRFRITEKFADSGGAVLMWQFSFGRPGHLRCICGASHLRFDDQGRIAWHRDYWDAAEEIYARLPVVGWFMRRLRRALSAPQPDQKAL